MSDSFNISEAARDYTSLRYNRPAWAVGAIGRTDAAFLFDMLMRERPGSILEIGVASGVSTAFLTTLLADRLRESRLYSFDRLEQLYSDESKPVGAHLFELFGSMPPNLTLVSGVSSAEIRSWPGRPEAFDLTFIDARHSHPCPCIDLLSLIEVLRPHSWVVLHDVFLPCRKRDSQQYGPLYLYHLWPGEKLAPDEDDVNIGAIRLFEDRCDSVAAVLGCCQIPWSERISHSEWTGALAALQTLDRRLHDNLQRIVSNPPLAGRPDLRNCDIVVRGANPWSHFAADPTAERIILHANRMGEPKISIAIRGLDRARCCGIVFPSIARSADATLPLTVTLSLRDEKGKVEANRTLLLTDSIPRFEILTIQKSKGVFDAEIAVSLAVDTDKIRNAWVKFDAVHFI